MSRILISTDTRKPIESDLEHSSLFQLVASYESVAVDFVRSVRLTPLSQEIAPISILGWRSRRSISSLCCQLMDAESINSLLIREDAAHS